MATHIPRDRVTEVSDERWFIRQVIAGLGKGKNVRAGAEIVWNVSKIVRKTPSIRTSQIGKHSSWFARAVLLSARTDHLFIPPAPDFDEHAYLKMYSDVREGVQAGRLSSGFAHYVKHGRREGRLRPALSDPRGAAANRERSSEAIYAELFDSRLFDPVWYNRYGYDLPGDQAFDHFYHHGRKRGHQPCFYFDGEWYLRNNADVRRAGMDPLLHYIRHGEFEGRKPSPIFDPVWYAAQYAITDSDGLALADYLAHRAERDPCADFDTQHYLQHNADVRSAGVDPVEHYVSWGYRENRDPSPHFSTRLYVQRHLGGSYDQNPLIHFIEHGRHSGLPLAGEDGPHRGVAGEIKKFVAQGPDFEEWQPPRRGGRSPGAKVIAFYLPQFHRIAENDAWWGTGFTEWTNLSRGVPRCRGHYQPRTPRDLGFYDLTNPEAIRRQVELAKAAGLHGFCFYFYWFNEKRLLERPVDLFLRDQTIDFPFCLLWGNENWTRRWDGLESEILMEQLYDPRHDESLVATLAEYFKHPNYIRANGRPVFTIYRADQVPDGKARFAKWRELWRNQHGLDPLFLMAQSFNNVDPTDFGLDGAIEFPPHQLIRRCSPVPFAQLDMLDPGFSGSFYRYEDMAAAGMAEIDPPFPLMKTVAPSWDNDARRQGSGNVFLGSTPRLYEQWLSSAITHARTHPVAGESIVFVNAWNEWAEGTYLEPDVHFGAAYLNATARAIYNLGEHADAGRKILIVGHDAHRYGAQAIALSLVRTLQQQFGATVTVLLLDGGPLLDDHRAICRTVVLPKADRERDALLRELKAEGYDLAILNTTVSGAVAPHLSRAGVRFITLVHELPRFVAERHLEQQARQIAKYSDAIVFPHGFVRDGFKKTVGEHEAQLLVRPQGNYNTHEPAESAREDLRKQLGIDSSARIVLNVGRGDLRKGFDLFVAAARQTVPEMDDVHFVWLGKVEPEMELWLMPPEDDSVLRGRFHHIQFAQDPATVMNVIGGADLFFLSSREDPYPTVVMEAYAAGLDLVAYDGGGGYADMVRANGRLLDRSDAGTTSQAIKQLLAQTSARGILEKRKARQPIVRNEMSPDRYAADLLAMLDPDWRRVSVILPNYNYGRHLRARLASIFEQTYPVFEVIVLDDASTDDSLAVVSSVCAEYQREVRIIRNEQNSGSAFRQWRKGLEAARGEYVWIAEADDVAHPNFLATATRALRESDAAFAFTDSWQIDEHDHRIGDSYAPYCNNGRRTGQFSRDFVMSGREFLNEHLAVKNTILNVSAVVWRRESIAKALSAVGESLHDYRVAGDWRLYAEAAMANEPVSYVSEALNGHRRHSASITHALEKRRHLEEIVDLHRLVEQMLKLDAAKVRTQKDYETEIATQFGIQEWQR